MKQHRFDKDFMAIMEAVNDVYYGKAIQDMTPDEIHAQQEMLEKGESTKKSSMLKKAADAIGQAVSDFKQGQKDATTAKEKPKKDTDTDTDKDKDTDKDTKKGQTAPAPEDLKIKKLGDKSGRESPDDPNQPKGKETSKGKDKPPAKKDGDADKDKGKSQSAPKPEDLKVKKPKPKAKTEPKTDSKPKPKAEPKPETKPKADSAQDRERKKKTSFASKVRSTAKGVKAGVSGAADVNVKQGVKWGKNAYKADQRKEIKRNLKKKKK